MALTKYIIMPGADYQAACDKLREKSGKTDPIRSGDLASEIEAVSATTGGVPLPFTIVSDVPANHIVSVISIADDMEASMEAFPPYELSSPKCYYNGVLLPGIPAEMLVRYPYALIRKDEANGSYNLVFGRKPWYYISQPALVCQDISSLPYYSIPITSSADAMVWNFTKDAGGINLGLATNRTILWSNHDIPNGSATATEIYFEGSKPIPV